jgi:hypothetical protein
MSKDKGSRYIYFAERSGTLVQVTVEEWEASWRLWWEATERRRESDRRTQES